MAAPVLGIMTFGRSGVDICPPEIDNGLDDIDSFGKFLDGSPTNVAVAAARIGHVFGEINHAGTPPSATTRA